MPQIRRWWQSSSPNAGETVRPPESGCGGSEKDESARKMAKPLAIDLFCGLGGRQSLRLQLISDVWRAMIDAALSQKQDEGKP